MAEILIEKVERGFVVDRYNNGTERHVFEDGGAMLQFIASELEAGDFCPADYTRGRRDMLELVKRTLGGTEGAHGSMAQALMRAMDRRVEDYPDGR